MSAFCAGMTFSRVGSVGQVVFRRRIVGYGEMIVTYELLPGCYHGESCGTLEYFSRLGRIPSTISHSNLGSPTFILHRYLFPNHLASHHHLPGKITLAQPSCRRRGSITTHRLYPKFFERSGNGTRPFRPALGRRIRSSIPL